MMALLRCRKCKACFSFWMAVDGIMSYSIRPTYQKSKKSRGRWRVEVQCRCGHVWMSTNTAMKNLYFRAKEIAKMADIESWARLGR